MTRWARRILGRQTNLVLACCATFLLGLVLGRFGVSISLWFGVVIGGVGLLVAKSPTARFGFLAIACLAIGLWRGAGFYAQLEPFRVLAYQKVTITVTAKEDATYATGGQLSFTAGDVRFVEPLRRETPGSVRIKGYGELAVYRGDRIKVEGKLYPTRGSTQASIGFAKIHRIGGHNSLIDEFRRRFAAGLQTALAEPQASFGMGLLIGQRNTLPDDITQSLKMVGLAHIIAVSGYNLTIMLTATRRLMNKQSKLATTVVAVGLMLGFIGLTGASASIVRAAVISALGLAAWYVGREVRPMVLILLAAALTAGANPVYIWSDIGWYLSFLAFSGILMLAPQIFRRVWGERKPPVLAAVAVETLCAEIMTIPLVMFIFGQVSLIGLLANVLVATVIPLAMLLCFVAGVVGMAVPLLVGWVAWPAQLVLTYMLDVATALSRVPHSFQTNVYITAFDMALCYAALVTILFALYRPARQNWVMMTERIRGKNQ